MLNGVCSFKPKLRNSMVSSLITVFMQRRKEIVHISLGAKALNELLGGGLETKCITEIYGEYR